MINIIKTFFWYHHNFWFESFRFFFKFLIFKIIDRPYTNSLISPWTQKEVIGQVRMGRVRVSHPSDRPLMGLNFGSSLLGVQVPDNKLPIGCSWDHIDHGIHVLGHASYPIRVVVQGFQEGFCEHFIELCSVEGSLVFSCTLERMVSRVAFNSGNFIGWASFEFFGVSADSFDFYH